MPAAAVQPTAVDTLMPMQLTQPDTLVCQSNAVLCMSYAAQNIA